MYEQRHSGESSLVKICEGLLPLQPLRTHPGRRRPSATHCPWLITFGLVYDGCRGNKCFQFSMLPCSHMISLTLPLIHRPDNPVEPCIRYLLPEDPTPSKERYIGRLGN